MLPKKVLNFLKKEKITPKILTHKTVYTAFDKAKTLKISPSIVVKTIVVKLEKTIGLFLLPADKKLDFKKVKKISKKFSLLKETEIKKKFKGVKIGAIPPFGKLWGLPIFADTFLKNKKKIIVSGGNWNISLEISPKLLEKLAEEFKWIRISGK